MDNQQPKPDPKCYERLISDIKDGIIKVPKFQRDFVWSVDKTAQLLDSILKMYPIGTFILWETGQRISHVNNIGDQILPEPPEDRKVQYVLDGQQRITSLYAAYTGAKIQKYGEKKTTDYKNIYVDLSKDIEDDESQVITAEKPEDSITLTEVLRSPKNPKPIHNKYPKHDKKISIYASIFLTYQFPTVVLRKDDIGSAIEVFTRINTGGQTLTLFEIMCAKTYDEKQKFDMQEKWTKFIEKLDTKKYEDVSSSVILNLLSLILTKTKECSRKDKLGLEKQDIIDTWDSAIAAIEQSIDYFRKSFRIPISRLLPYDTLLVPFAYCFYKTGNNIDAEQRKYLEEFFWRTSLSFRYSSAAETKLGQDIKQRIDKILKNERPEYDDLLVRYSADDIINTEFRASNSYCKAILCLLASQTPKDFKTNDIVILDNSWLKVANSKNYHHFFPKNYLKRKKIENENSLANITFISSSQNKGEISDRAPSDYIGEFEKKNKKIKQSLQTHFINLDDSTIQHDNYESFLENRANKIAEELESRLNPK